MNFIFVLTLISKLSNYNSINVNDKSEYNLYLYNFLQLVKYLEYYIKLFEMVKII